jgi:Zn-dependent peptidase ImmA (M78 family)
LEYNLEPKNFTKDGEYLNDPDPNSKTTHKLKRILTKLPLVEHYSGELPFETEAEYYGKLYYPQNSPKIIYNKSHDTKTSTMIHELSHFVSHMIDNANYHN